MTEATLKAILKQAGYRDTAARRAVLRAIAQSGDHFPAESLWQKGKTLYPRLGRATVYRTLDTLVGLGALRPIVAAGGGHIYAAARDGHHHLVCSGCGVMTDFRTQQACEEWEGIARRNDFELSGHLVELYGTCKDCRSPGRADGPPYDEGEGIL